MTHYGGLYKAIIGQTLFAYPGLQEECLSDVFLLIWTRISDYKPTKGSFKSWSAAICRYQAIDYLRRQARVPIIVPWEEDHQGRTDPKDPFWMEELNRLLAPLFSQDRDIFLALFLEGQASAEVAQAQNMTLPNLYNRVPRGRKKIRQASIERRES